jgi:hypothetical protein
VQFSVVSGGGSVAGFGQVSTDGAGFQYREVRLGPFPGPNVFRATVAGLGSIDVSIQGVVPGSPDRLFCSTPYASCFRSLPAGGSSPSLALVTAVDAEGLPVPSATVSFAPVRTMGVASPPLPSSRVTNVDGVAGFGFVADQVARSDTLASATLLGLPASRRFVFLTVGADVASFLQSLQVFAPRVGQPITPGHSIIVRDRFGNLASVAIPITASIAAGPAGATLSGSTFLTSVNGIATFTNLRLSPVGPGYQLRFSSPGVTDGVSNVFTVIP